MFSTITIEGVYAAPYQAQKNDPCTIIYFGETTWRELWIGCSSGCEDSLSAV